MALAAEAKRQCQETTITLLRKIKSLEAAHKLTQAHSTLQDLIYTRSLLLEELDKHTKRRYVLGQRILNRVISVAAFWCALSKTLNAPLQFITYVALGELFWPRTRILPRNSKTLTRNFIIYSPATALRLPLKLVLN